MTKKITFLLASELADGADTGIVVGDFNGWSHDDGLKLDKQKDGSLKATIALETGKAYQYRYFLNDGRWVNDGNANSYNFDPQFGVDNCVIFVEADAPKVAAAPKTKKAAPAPKAVVETPKPEPVKVAPAKKAAAPKVVAPKVATPKAVPAPKVAAKPAPKAAAVADDLTKIEGVGKKIAELLQAAGITNFQELGKATAKTLKTILADAGSRYQMHDPATWPKQSKLAAAGKWDDLKSLQQELKGGK